MENKQNIPAIETQYGGDLFRSRIEARWAVFFDCLGLQWEYEKEGYELPDGTRYLPDFWLPTVGKGAWFEVKGATPTREEERKCELLAQLTHSRVYLTFGGIPRLDKWGQPPDNSMETFFSFLNSETSEWETFSDQPYWWCKCDYCGVLGIEYSGRAGRLCQCQPGQDKGYNFDCPQIVSAYEVARNCRFDG